LKYCQEVAVYSTCFTYVHMRGSWRIPSDTCHSWYPHSSPYMDTGLRSRDTCHSGYHLHDSHMVYSLGNHSNRGHTYHEKYKRTQFHNNTKQKGLAMN